MAALVLAAGLGATALAWRHSAEALRAKLEENFEFRIRDAEDRVRQRLAADERALRGVAGLFAASPGADRAAFARFVAAHDPARELKGIQAIGYQPLVPAEALAAHEAAVRREGFPAYAVRTPVPRAAYAPVVYVEPFTASNARVLGFDPLGEPTRRQALERARDLGAPALSGKVALVQEAEGTAAPGAVLYLPLYRGGVVPEGVEARRAALVGWVYVAFRAGDLMEGLLGERGGDLDFEVYDGEEPAAAALLHDTHAAAARPEGARTARRRLELAGQPWTLVFHSLGRFEARLGDDRPRIVATAGALATLLLAALAWALASGRARVQAALHRSESLHRLLMRSFPEGAVGLFDRDLVFRLADGAEVAGLPPPAAWLGRALAEVAPRRWLQPLEGACRVALAGRTAQASLDHEGRSLEATFHPVHGRAGEAALGVVLVRDVTERRAAEAQRAVGDRLKALSTLVAGLAHEVNNPLAGQLSSQTLAGEALDRARALLREPGPPPVEALAALVDEAREEVSDAEVGARRIARLVRDLAVLGHAEQARVPTALAGAAARAAAWAEAQGRPEVRVRVEDAGAPEVLAAPEQVEQLVRNLLANACAAVPPGRPGVVTVRVGPGGGGAARLEVEDDGEGIPPAVAGRIFDPFFTTRDVGRGMGLGLSICHAIVTAHGGTIAVTSDPGRGTTFRVELPGLPPRAG